MDAETSNQKIDAPHPEAAWMLRPDEVTVHLIASGLITLTQPAQERVALALPYPPPLQRGLNRLVLACLRRKRPPPQSVMDLLDWCRRPLISWGLDLPDGSVADDERLLDDDQIPTATCEAWARSGGDIEAELSEERLLLNVISTCRNTHNPQAYTAFRRMLIERPALTAFEFQMALNEPHLDILIEHLRAAYEPAPRSAAHNGQWATCAICGNLLLRSRRHQLICQNEQCRAQGHMKPARVLPLRDEIVWLRRDLRRYIAAPGRAELRLATNLEALGLQIELWPDFDRYDIRVTFPNQTVWAVDVKDWSNPFLLARSVNNKPFPNDPPWDRAFFVFPDARRAQRPDYVRAFRNASRALSDRVEACFESDLLRRAKEQLEGGDHA
ncbi:MAG: hypothetical protein RMJ55_10115 [Roseiflexaceae bacterium]|nr:hypothetical protein [Roseiflexus sp.]MDW8213903.1 hypothetical protein [Roseiflexaceae bacterium]